MRQEEKKLTCRLCKFMHYGRCWQTKAKAAQNARHVARYRARVAMRSAGLTEFKPEGYTVRRENGKRGVLPDADNALAACKAYLDGCADAFGVNDRGWDIDTVERLHGDARRVSIIFFRENEEGGAA